MNTNEIIEDRTIRHAVYLQRLAGGYTKKMIPYFEQLEKDLLSLVDSDSYSARKRTILLAQVKQLHTAATAKFSKELIQGVNDLGVYEAGFTAKVLTAATTATAAVPTDTAILYAVNRARLDAPMSNLTIHQALAKFGTKKALNASAMISDAVLNNVSKEEAKKSLVSLLNIEKVQAETLVRSSVTLTANTSRNATYLENADIVEYTIYDAKLDGRTTDICIEHNGNKYPAGENPAGSLHWNCRSQVVAHVNKEYIK